MPLKRLFSSRVQSAFHSPLLMISMAVHVDSLFSLLRLFCGHFFILYSLFSCLFEALSVICCCTVFTAQWSSRIHYFVTLSYFQAELVSLLSKENRPRAIYLAYTGWLPFCTKSRICLRRLWQINQRRPRAVWDGGKVVGFIIYSELVQTTGYLRSQKVER